MAAAAAVAAAALLAWGEDEKKTKIGEKQQQFLVGSGSDTHGKRRGGEEGGYTSHESRFTAVTHIRWGQRGMDIADAVGCCCSCCCCCCCSCCGTSYASGAPFFLISAVTAELGRKGLPPYPREKREGEGAIEILATSVKNS